MFVIFVIITYKYLTRAPTTSAPTTRAPTTSAPTTSAPTTSAPTTSAPTTRSPTTRSPTTRSPTTSSPTTSAPTTRAPTTRAPTTSAPTTRAPTTRAPTTRAPTLAPIVPVGYFYLTNYNETKYPNSTRYGIVKGVNDVKASWPDKQWKMMPLWADDNDDKSILVRIYLYSPGPYYYFSYPERNDATYGCKWISNTYMNGAAGIGDDFMLKRVYQDQNKNWLTYDGKIIVKSDGTII
jgi:hypothetical protein